MPKIAKQLTDLEVRNLSSVGRHAVGGVAGLCKQVGSSTSASWILKVTVGGRHKEIGLGSCRSVSLKEARDRARQLRVEVGQGIDPKRPGPPRPPPGPFRTSWATASAHSLSRTATRAKPAQVRAGNAANRFRFRWPRPATKGMAPTPTCTGWAGLFPCIPCLPWSQNAPAWPSAWFNTENVETQRATE